MRIVACGLITGAALLGAVPVAIADAPVSTTSSNSRAAPHAEVSMLAVSLTVGGAVAAAGSGTALVLTRRRALSSVTDSPVQDHVTSDQAPAARIVGPQAAVPLHDCGRR